MARSALREYAGRGTRLRRAFALAAALWAAAPAAHADDGMIVIPGRGETAETALAHANAASGEQFGGKAGAVRDTGGAGGMAGAPGIAAGGASGMAGAIGVAAAGASGMADTAGVAAAGASGMASATSAGGGSRWAGVAAGASAAQPAGSMVVTSVPAPASVPAPVPRPVHAAARANAANSGYGAPRAADPAGVATVVAGTGTADASSNPARQTLAARMAAARAVSATPVARAPAPAATSAAQQTQPGQQDPESIRRTALAFLQQQIAGLPGKTTATVAAAFPRGLAACTTLEPFLPTGARLWGRTTVGVRCAGERPWTVYLQAKVTVQATYYVAARQITPGEPLTAADLVARDGDLTVLPLAVITDPAQAVGATALARIAAGLPLRQDMLKSAASVSAGQTVRVVAAGPGFTISAEGSALANAAPGQSVRVRMAAGQIVTAVVKDAGTVEIPL
ncbi:flagellar basal body P-ring formation chaperone FlgA [Burkholderia latens]|uniref:Flagellar basal body P-ring biosynthesis protein FlgA n=2 Tax=Burkholderia latens TaxID=488446 RepID=A0A6P2PN23_9BURK|nr:flagellar basal body P-ring formation chaperone FlgA [Burkholderia latens]VWC10877.1 flagellar basal body P-ring biosynthesis protein FlgA [Burkholderia latens]